MSIQLTGLSRHQALYNARIKTYPDGSRQLLLCDRPVFNPDRVELRQRRSFKDKKNNMDKDFIDSDRRSRRAMSKLKDYVLCNPFEYFVTLTLSPDKIDRTDYSAVIHKLNKWLDNAVQRRQLQYVLVPEYHKDRRAIHFHGLINNRLPLVDSGTVSVQGVKKPVKQSTYTRHYKGKECHTVYNIPSWCVGFSTAIELYGSRMRVARYIGKYLEKDFTKVGGRYYLHSNNLELPQVDYVDMDYDTYPRKSFSIPGAPNNWKSEFIS